MQHIPMDHYRKGFEFICNEKLDSVVTTGMTDENRVEAISSLSNAIYFGTTIGDDNLLIKFLNKLFFEIKNPEDLPKEGWVTLCVALKTLFQRQYFDQNMRSWSEA